MRETEIKRRIKIAFGKVKKIFNIIISMGIGIEMFCLGNTDVWM